MIFFRIIIYLILQIIFVPLVIIGMIVGLLVELRGSKKHGVSFSAGQSLQYRWIMHYFETREDELSVRFTKAYPAESHIALWFVMGALIIAQRLFGFKTKLGKLVKLGYETIDTTSGIRVLLFDQAIEKHMDNVEQLVIPGVGFDLIANKYTNGTSLKVFEIDQTNTINLKQKTLQKSGIKSDWITYIPVDYDVESWSKKLVDVGFDATKKTLFLWQSVSLYLTPKQVETTLLEMKQLAAPGSVIVQDFYSLAFLEGELSSAAKKQMNLIKKAGEPWQFGLDMKEQPKEKVGAYLASCGLLLTNYYQFGEKTTKEAWYCIVESIIE